MVSRNACDREQNSTKELRLSVFITSKNKKDIKSPNETVSPHPFMQRKHMSSCKINVWGRSMVEKRAPPDANQR